MLFKFLKSYIKNFCMLMIQTFPIKKYTKDSLGTISFNSSKSFKASSCLSREKYTEARWNLHNGFFGSIEMALFKVAKEASIFFKACKTWKTKVCNAMNNLERDKLKKEITKI